MRLVPLTRLTRQRTARSDAGQPTLRSEMDRMLNRYFQMPMAFPDDLGSTMGAWIPSIDVSETENEIVLRAELPGVDPDNINITVAGGHLVLSGEKSEVSEEQDEHYYHCERSFGAFERSVELPDSADADNVSADYNNGVLTVHVPKRESAKPKRIQVESTSQRSKQVAVGEEKSRDRSGQSRKEKS